MKITQGKDGWKSVKTFSLNELIENMRDNGAGRIVREFCEELQEYSPGYLCPAGRMASGSRNHATDTQTIHRFNSAKC